MRRFAERREGRQTEPVTVKASAAGFVWPSSSVNLSRLRELIIFAVHPEEGDVHML
jgi:hypothetical protein